MRPQFSTTEQKALILAMEMDKRGPNPLVYRHPVCGNIVEEKEIHIGHKTES